MTDDLLTRARRLEAYAAQDPGNLPLLLDLAQTWHRAGEHEHALAALGRAEAIPGGAARCVPLKGNVLLALGRWHEASALFEDALRQAPDSPALLFNLGHALLSGDDAPRAVQVLRRAVELDPSNPRFLFEYALAVQQAGDAEAAAQALERVLEVDARHADGLATLAWLRLDAGQFEQALALAERCIAAHPGHPAGWQIQGQVALFTMDGAAAAKSLRRALDLDPTDNDTRVALAQAALMQGRVRHARALLDESVAREPSHDGALCMLGWACAADDDAAGATGAFERAVAAAPNDPDALAGLAAMRLAGGLREEASTLAQHALTLEPQHVVASLVAARAHELQGHTADARALAESALAAAPFGPLRQTVAQALRAGASSPGVRRLQRRHARARSAGPPGR